MTLHDWREQMTAKGITHNDAVRMLKDAEAEIDFLNKTLATAQELVDVSVEQMTHEANKAAALQEKIEQLRSALRLIAAHTAEPGTALETVVKFAAATLETESEWNIVECVYSGGVCNSSRCPAHMTLHEATS